MKNLSTLLILVFALSCTKAEKAIEWGQVSIKAQNGETIFTETKAELAQIPDTYLVYLNKVGESTPVKSGTYADMKNAFTVEAGNYTAYAQNITESDALVGRGAQRFYGSTSNPISVLSGQTTTISFTCSMVNSRVTFEFDNSFKSVFNTEDITNPTKIVSSTASNPSRIIEYTKAASHSSELAYFNIDASGNTVLNYTIQTARKDGVAKTYNGTINLLAKSWHKVTIKASSTSGQADLDIVIDTQVAELPQDVMVDPY